MNRSEPHGISQTEIKRLQETINKQLEDSPLKKKMQASEIYSELNQKPKKTSVIMQTSALSPPKQAKQAMKVNIYKDEKKDTEKKEKNPKTSRVIAQKNTQEKKAEQREFLITQNKNLKQQTLFLIDQLQNILGETKQKKYGINLNDENQPEQVKLKKATIAKQLAKITQIQSSLAYEKRQLKYVYDDEVVTKEEAETKILQNQLQKLEKDKKAITNILKEQIKGIQLVSMTPEFREKFERTKNQLDKIKQQCKVLQSKTLENERLLKKKHQKLVGHHAKIKKIERILKEKQKKKGAFDKIVTLEMMAEVEQQISELQSQKMMSEKAWGSKISNIEAELETRKLQEERKMLILKEKQKEVRLNDLRIKELKKLVQSQNAQRRKVSISGDQLKKQPVQQLQLNQGRKRNIIQMQSKDRQSGQQQKQ